MLTCTYASTQSNQTPCCHSQQYAKLTPFCACLLLFCCLAGITATLVCFPLDVLRTRLMAPWGHKYGGPLRTLQGMAKFEGLGALYAGGRWSSSQPLVCLQLLFRCCIMVVCRSLQVRLCIVNSFTAASMGHVLAQLAYAMHNICSLVL
jgi:hypothetical protein